MERNDPSMNPEDIYVPEGDDTRSDSSPLDDDRPGSQGEVDPGSEGDFGDENADENAGENGGENASDALSRMPPR